MSAPRIGQRDRRALAVGAVLLAPLLLWTYAVAPYLRAVEGARERLERERTTLRREIGMLEQVDSYPAAFEREVAALSQSLPRLLGGTSESARTAELTAYVQARARRSRVAVSRVEALRPTGGGLTRTPIRLSGESDLQGVVELLRALESGPLLLHLDQLRLATSRGVAVAPGQLPGDLQTLSLDLTVTGFSLPAAGADSTPRRPVLRRRS